jgi:hypothetical protein
MPLPFLKTEKAAKAWRSFTPGKTRIETRRWKMNLEQSDNR